MKLTGSVQKAQRDTVSVALAACLAKLSNISMSDEDREAQRIGFAFGNVAIENPQVTRELVERVSRGTDNV